nr:pectinesterase, active site-containing protein [Tanacetum cinerariifolium]
MGLPTWHFKEVVEKGMGYCRLKGRKIPCTELGGLGGKRCTQGYNKKDWINIGSVGGNIGSDTRECPPATTNMKFIPKAPVRREQKLVLPKAVIVADATMAVIESDLGGFLNLKGYVPWLQAQNEKTCMFFEYKNKGPGASLKNRVKWSSLSIIKDDAHAQPYTLATFIDGEPWLQHSGAPFRPGLVGS